MTRKLGRCLPPPTAWRPPLRHRQPSPPPRHRRTPPHQPPRRRRPQVRPAPLLPLSRPTPSRSSPRRDPLVGERRSAGRSPPTTPTATTARPRQSPSPTWKQRPAGCAAQRRLHRRRRPRRTERPMTAKARESPRPRRVRTPPPRPRVGGGAVHGQPRGGKRATPRPDSASWQSCGSGSRRGTEPPITSGSALSAGHPRRTRMGGSSCCTAPRAVRRRDAARALCRHPGESRRSSMGAASTASPPSTGSPPVHDPVDAPAA